MKCYQGAAVGATPTRSVDDPIVRGIGAAGCLVSSSVVPTLERLNTAALRDTVRTFRDTVREHAHGLNRLNVYPVPDGDTGTNMARTLDAVVAEMDGTAPTTTTRPATPSATAR